MSYVVDYHIHSHYSDGTMSPVELVKKYKEDEYDIISITDHDGIDGLKEAAIAGESLDIKVVPGVELSTEHLFAPVNAAEGETLAVELHILGYDFDVENPALLEKLAELKRFRKERNAKLVEVLAEMGYPVDLEALEKQSKGGYVGKPNIARELVRGGYIEKVSDAWNPGKIFESDKVKAIRKEKLSSAEAIRLLTEAGGKAVLAHPAKIRGMGERGSDEFWKNMDILIRDLKKAGLKGVECYHPNHSEEEAWKLFQIAAKYHLHVTEGSDFHGKENE